MFTFTKHTKKMFIRMIAFLFIAFIIGCSGTDTVVKETKEVAGGGTDIGNPAPEVVVAGYAQKGPFRRYSTVWLSELNNDFEQTGRDFYDQTDSAGRFEIPAQLNSEYAELYIQGFYFDEINYNIENPHYIDSGGMLTSAIARVRDNESININVLTTIARDPLLALIDSGMTFDDAYAQTCIDVLNGFDITDDTNTLFEDMLILEEPGSGSPEGNKILLAVSAILMQISHDRCEPFCDGSSISAELSLLLGDISEDIALDGVLDDPVTLTAIENAIMSLEHTNIRTYMEDFFPDFNIPQFEEYILGDLNIQWDGFNCAGNGITSVEAVINDVETGTINAGPWACDGLEGTVIGLNAGNYDTITVNFLDSNNVVKFSAVKTEVSISPRQTTTISVNSEDLTTGALTINWSMDCAISNISTIEAEFYDTTDNMVGTGGPWNCSELQGSIGNIPEMTDGKVKIIFKNVDGDILCQSEKDGIPVNTGQSTYLGSFNLIPPTINSPVDGSIHLTGNTISFNGFAFDYQGNPLTGSDLSWDSDLDGPIGTGESFDSNILQQGIHYITLSATDTVLGSISSPPIILNISNAFYVGPSEIFTTIQSAVNYAKDNDIIVVRDGTYTENVYVNKPLTIQSENGYETAIVIASNANYSVFEVFASNVIIDGFTVYGSTPNESDYESAGIYIGGTAEDCTIINNRCGLDATHGNTRGIGVTTSNNIITNNICRYNSLVGIEINNSDFNLILGNDCSFNYALGIMMVNANRNILSGNNCSENSNSTGDLHGTGIWIYESENNYIYNNTTKHNRITGIAFLERTIGNIVCGNIIESNRYYGVYFSNSDCYDNITYLNTFKYNANHNHIIGNTVQNFPMSPKELNYIYNGSVYTNRLGNFYHNHILTDSNGNGVTDMSYDHDSFPLATTHNYYKTVYELILDTEAYGLWHYNLSEFSKISDLNADGICTFQSSLVIDFGTNGLWTYNGTILTDLGPWNPEGMAELNDSLILDLGTTGLFNYDGTDLIQISSLDPDGIEKWGNSLAIDFGTNGLWIYNGTTLLNLGPWDPEGMSEFNNSLALDLGTAGLFNYNGTDLIQISSLDPDGIEGWGNSLAIDFGANGLWNYNGTSMNNISSSNPEEIKGTPDFLAVDFGANGLWLYDGTSLNPFINWDAVMIDSVDFD